MLTNPTNRPWYNEPKTQYTAPPNPYVNWGDPYTGGGIRGAGDMGNPFSETWGSSSFTGGMGIGNLDPYAAAMMGMRGTGGTGGGAGTTSEDNMGANELIALSEFLGENVTSFAGGGRMRDPYRYEGGGQMNNLVNQLAAVSQISNLNRANKGMKMRKRYTQGGRF